MTVGQDESSDRIVTGGQQMLHDQRDRVRPVRENPVRDSGPWQRLLSSALGSGRCHMYSRFRIHTRVNQPQMGGR